MPEPEEPRPASRHPARVQTVATSSDTQEPVDRLEVFRDHRRLLFSIAYRMLGSAVDAEDVLQEAYIRWQQCEGDLIQSPRAFLATIVNRLCLNHLQSARVKREQYFGQWLPEPVLTGRADGLDLSPAIDGSLSTAFLLLLERLTPLERAVFLLHEVFDYDYREIALDLEQSEANCRQIFSRARQHLKQGRPRFHTTARQQQELLQRFLEASSRGDMDGLRGLFSKELVLYADGGGKATAVPNPIYGAENVARFLLGARRKLLPADLVRKVEQINGAPGVVTYLHGRPYSVLTFDVRDGRISNIYIVSNPEKLAHLPSIDPSPAHDG